MWLLNFDGSGLGNRLMMMKSMYAPLPAVDVDRNTGLIFVIGQFPFIVAKTSNLVLRRQRYLRGNHGG